MGVFKKQRKLKKYSILAVSAIIVIAISAGTVVFLKQNSAKSPAKQSNTTVAKSETTEIANDSKVDDVANSKPKEPVFDTRKYSTTDPSSLWVIANKQHPLSNIEYAPSDLVTTNGAIISSKAQSDFETMLATASSQGVKLIASSSYRSYATQAGLYNNYVATHGQELADTFSAKPGYSEHQTGLAIDFTGYSNPNCNFDDCYATTQEGGWLAEHAHEYGFLLRYTAEKQNITGYKNEPWHYRYIGKDLAKEMRDKGFLTLEEFFNTTGGISY